MIIFQLPDLGEGLPDAIIREWYVKPGDAVKSDQPLASMETAKALVDVPSPQAGTIEKLFGNPGDTIETGQPLVGFASADDTASSAGEHADTQTSHPGSGSLAMATLEASRIQVTPAIRALAKKLGVDLTEITPHGERITAAEVEQAAQKKSPSALEAGWESLSPVGRAMVLSMTHSHQQVAPITLCDDADIAAWDNQQNITVRLIRAVLAACTAVPKLNAAFDSEKMALRFHSEVNLGVAVDTEHGLYVPVIKNAAALSDNDLRARIDQFKQQAQDKALAQADLHGATLILSNFGSLAGRYGNPIIIPPMVAIIGVGKAREAVVPVDGKPAIHRIIPLSISIDHRVITGGEAARFLRHMLDELAKGRV